MPATQSDRQWRVWSRVRGCAGWLQSGWHLRLVLVGVLLVVGCATAALVTAREVERQRRGLPASALGAPATVDVDQAVVGLALDAARVPPGLEPGTRVAVLDTGSGEGQPLVGGASVTTVASLPGGTAGGLRVGLEVPASAAGIVAVAGVEDRVALAALPMA